MKAQYKNKPCCWRWLMLSVFLLLAFTVNAQFPLPPAGSPITIDGQPGDWADAFLNPAILSTFVVDLKQANGTDNQFTQGAKDFSSAADMAWSYSQVNDKNEITNAGVIVWEDPATHDKYMFFMGDRVSSNGTAEIGFWVFQNGTAPNETTMRFSPEKEIGDILILFTFTQGGRVPNLQVYEWMGLGYSGTDRLKRVEGFTDDDAGAWVSNPADFGMTYYGVPPYIDDVYGPWEYCNKENKDCGKYYRGSFVEGYVNLTALNLEVDLCGATFLMETRVSQSLTSMLNDFVYGSIGSYPEIAATNDQVCPGYEATVCATYPDGSPINGSGWDFQWYDADMNELLGETGVCLTKVVDGTYGEEVKFYVVATSEFVCSSDPAMAIVTFKPYPVAENQPRNKTVYACNFADQAALNNAFTDWLSTEYAWILAGVTQGVNPDLTGPFYNPAEIPVLCDGGFIDVSWLLEDECDDIPFAARFTLNIPPAVEVTGPADESWDTCDFEDQAGLTAAWEAWLAQFQVLEAGCGVEMPTLPTVGPVLCNNFNVTVTYYIEDLCTWDQHIASFSVTAPPAVEVTGPADESWDTCDFEDQAGLTAAWEAWLAKFEVVEEGCGVEMPTLPTVGPVLCNNFNVTVTYYIEDLCTWDQHIASFSVTAPPAVEVTGPADESWDTCDFEDQAGLTAAWEAWLAKFEVVEEGCGVEMPTLPTVGPVLCNNFNVTVTYYIEDLCTWDQHIASFSVTAPPAVEVTGPANETWDACQFEDQAGLTAVWEAWLAKFEVVEEGCGVEMPTLPSVGPVLCQEFNVTVNYYAEDICTSDVHTATFILTKPEPIQVYCDPGPELAACTPYEDILEAFNSWKDGFYHTGGCPDATTNKDELMALDLNDYDLIGGDVITFEYIVYDICDRKTVTCEFIVPPCYPNCETAFALGSNATCFIDQGFGNWGWTNYIAGYGTYTWPLWAAAGQCNTAKGQQVGTVTVVYNGYVDVTFNLFPGFNLYEEHVYAGYGMFPIGSNGMPTTAPGQYYNDGPFTGGIYVIVHGVVCGQFEYTPAVSKKPEAKKPGVNLKIMPNPFRDHAQIIVNAESDMQIAVEVYNVTGARVAVLYEGMIFENDTRIINYEAEGQFAGTQFFMVVVRTPYGVSAKKILQNR